MIKPWRGFEWGVEGGGWRIQKTEDGIQFWSADGTDERGWGKGKEQRAGRFEQKFAKDAKGGAGRNGSNGTDGADGAMRDAGKLEIPNMLSGFLV